MKKIIVLLAAVALVATGLQWVPVAAGEAPAPSELKFFLGSSGCTPDTENLDYLSTTDADDEIECFHTGSGARNEIGEEVGTSVIVPAPDPVGPRQVVANRDDATRKWDTVDGGPITLDASRPVTGSIFTSGGECPVADPAPCSPQGLGAGEVILDITLVGISGGKEVALGTQTETFEVTPGAPTETVVKIQPDAALTGTVFETIELRTWIHGKSAGHGVVKTTGDANSFITIPTASAAPGKATPPGKKKGCSKGKGKKKGCTKPRP